MRNISYIIVFSYESEEWIKPILQILLISIGVTLLTKSEKLYKFCLITLFFPIYLRFAERDALTLTSLLIFLLGLTVLLITPHLLTKIINYKPAIWLALIFTVYMIFIMVAISSTEMGPTIRRGISELSSVTLFFLSLVLINNRDKLEKILKLLMAIASIEVLIAVIQVLFPEIPLPLQIFSPRDLPSFTVHFRQLLRAGGTVVEGLRAKGTLNDYELLAEMFAVIVPIAFAFTFNRVQKKAIYYILCGWLLIGILCTGTRGAVFSAMVGIMIVIAFQAFKTGAWKTGRRFMLVLIGLLVTVITISLIFPALTGAYSDKLLEPFFAISGGSDLDVAMNRKELWQRVWMLIPSVPIFGFGFNRPFSFHSLYLTIGFEMGIAGLGIFVIMLVMISIASITNLKNIKTNEGYSIQIGLFASLITLLVDEVKVEFVRQSAMTQFAWLIFALTLIAAKNGNNESVSNRRETKIHDNR